MRCRMARGGRRPGAGRPRSSASPRQPASAKPRKLDWGRHPYSSIEPAKRSTTTPLRKGATPVSQMRSTAQATAPQETTTRRIEATSYGSGPGTKRGRWRDASGRWHDPSTVAPASPHRPTARHFLDDLWAPAPVIEAEVERLPAPGGDPLAEPDPTRPKRGRPSRSDPFASDLNAE